MFTCCLCYADEDFYCFDVVLDFALMNIYCHGYYHLLNVGYLPIIKKISNTDKDVN